MKKYQGEKNKRTTLYLNEEMKYDLSVMALKEKVKVNDLIVQALQNKLVELEKKHGPTYFL